MVRLLEGEVNQQWCDVGHLPCRSAHQRTLTHVHSVLATLLHLVQHHLVQLVRRRPRQEELEEVGGAFVRRAEEGWVGDQKVEDTRRVRVEGVSGGGQNGGEGEGVQSGQAVICRREGEFAVVVQVSA